MSSGSSKREREQKRKLQHFLNDLALLGSLQGFKYFQPWLRGKEELLLTVVNEDLGWRSPGFVVSRASSSAATSSCNSSDVSPSSSSPSVDSRSSSPLPGEPAGPRDPQPQTHTKRQPQTARDPSSEEHLLPASPSEREIAVPEVNCTLFLLAGYVKYGRPYAWIRSNHERLVNIGGTDSMVKDTPMKLKSISDWQTRGIRVWDIVSELVCLCTVPSPSNPSLWTCVTSKLFPSLNDSCCGGGEAPQAFPCSVPAGVTATQRDVRLSSSQAAAAAAAAAGGAGGAVVVDSSGEE
ncbi:hypothetical protein INR49_025525 [Caranx melampygus]|nr:hypothetical protein INR49_025525 [Caranx melampygus]